MSFTSSFLAAVAVVTLSMPAFADGITINDAYARSAFKGAKSGAAFMQIMNHTDQADRLIGVKSESARKVELHTHRDMGEGVMKMMHVKEGFTVPAGGLHSLARGGDHVMLMGLTKPFLEGEHVEMTLIFEKAGEIIVKVPVDLLREDHNGAGHDEIDHSNHNPDK